MIEIISIGLFILSLVYSIYTRKHYISATAENKQILSQKKSSEIVLGQIAEQLAPFTDRFKYDAHKVKFLGQPIDYIYFGEDKIVLLEVKSGNAKLTPKQIQIKNLVKNKQVYWEEFRIPEKVKNEN